MRSNADRNEAKECCSWAATLQKTASNFFHLWDLPYPAWLKLFPLDFTHMFLKTNSSRLNLSSSKNNTKLLSFTTGSFAKLILYILFISELLNCFGLITLPLYPCLFILFNSRQTDVPLVIFTNFWSYLWSFFLPSSPAFTLNYAVQSAAGVSGYFCVPSVHIHEHFTLQIFDNTTV